METYCRVTRLRVAGLRLIDDVVLDLEGLHVLIGQNGSGKSTIVEALEILRRSASSEFAKDLANIHGGFLNLRRHGASQIQLAIDLRLGRSAKALVFRYEIHISNRGIEFERLEQCAANEGEDQLILLRVGGKRTVNDVNYLGLDSTVSALARLDREEYGGNIGLFLNGLASIAVHVPFEVRALWVAVAHGLPNLVRNACLVAPAPELERLGTNLANAFQALRNELGVAEWNETMDWIRLGLGDCVETVTVRADASGGNVALWLKHAGIDLWLPARALSEGELQYLCLVALCRLSEKSAIVVIDEPEAHLHPHLQHRAMQLLERLAERTSVLVSTHSRHMLDALRDPTASVRVCRRTDAKPAAMEISPLDGGALSAWMEDYSGLGRVLDQGLESLVVREGEPDRDPA